MSTQPEISSIYHQRYEHFNKLATDFETKYTRISYLRLVYFLVGLVGLIYLFSKAASIALWLLIPFLGVFAAMVKWHDRIKAQRDYYRNLTSINEWELSALDHQFHHFESGAEFADADHPYLYDLDIFGDRSVYQFINRTVSLPGKRTLAKWLSQPAAKKEIEARQQATAELKELLDWRQDLQAIGMQLNEETDGVQTVLKWLQEPFFILNSSFIKTATFTMPVIMLASMVLYYFSVVPLWVPVLCWITNLLFIKYTYQEVTNTVRKTASNADLLKVYHRLFEHIESPSFESEKLRALQQRLQVNGQQAAATIKELGGLSANLNIRENEFAYLVFNTFFLWELIFCYRLEQWKQRMQHNMADWFAALGEWEALASFGSLYFNHPNWSQAVIHDHYCEVKGKGVAHFLIPEKVRVNNPVGVDSKGKIILITGSNMSGKSTYMRTVGVNLVLAMAGAPVCASAFATSEVFVYTSMRNKDSLQESESSFYAELKGLKKIIDVVEKGEIPVFFLLDEILKGTNSHDRHKGSVALIRQLLRDEGAGMIATHDLALCDMAERFPGAIENWCFEVEIKESGMVFDYKIRPGVCQSLNATRLMQQMGIDV